MLLENRLTLQRLSITSDLLRKKSLDKTYVLVDVEHLRLLAECIQNIPEKLKPCSGPLVKIIIFLSAFIASSSLTTSLKSMNENVCRFFFSAIRMRMR